MTSNEEFMDMTLVNIDEQKIQDDLWEGGMIILEI